MYTHDIDSNVNRSTLFMAYLDSLNGTGTGNIGFLYIMLNLNTATCVET